VELKLSLEELEEARNKILSSMAAKEFSPTGFATFYERLHGNKLPRYALDEWIIPIFEAKKIDKGKEIFSFRGSWKTTTVSVTFTAFFIGHHPELANLIICSSGSNANIITGAIKNIIEYTDAWKATFPDVVPDKKRGWGEDGYEVMRTDMSYEDWRGLNTHRKDPTLLGLGVESKTLIGKHPEGILLMDDILDEDNTVSVRQMTAIATKVTSTILPFIVRDDTKEQKLVTWPIVIGTPWQEDDVYQDIKDTGRFDFSSVPIMKKCLEGEGIYIEYGKLEPGWYKLTEPNRFSIESIEYFYDTSGHKEFMRMYMLDVYVKVEGDGLAFHTYPHDKIDFSWPMVCGVDYMSLMKDKKVDLKNRAYYAQAYLFKMPDGRAVLGDGWFGRPSQMEAEDRLKQARAFPGHRFTVFESDGKGEEALQLFLRNPETKLVPMETHGKGKPERLEKQLGPWLENGRILISDGDTPFLEFTKKCLNKYPRWFKDPIDALYWAMMGMPEVLVLEKLKEGLPLTKKKEEKLTSPWESVGSN